MNQTPLGAARTKLITDHLTKNCKAAAPYKVETGEARDIQHWRIGQTDFLLFTYPNGYNLFASTSTKNNPNEDLSAITASAIDIFNGEKEA